MGSSFDAMTEETRQLALLDDGRGRGGSGARAQRERRLSRVAVPESRRRCLFARLARLSPWARRVARSAWVPRASRGSRQLG